MDIRIEGEETPKEVKNTPDSTLVPHGEIDRMQLAQTFDLKPSEAGKYKKELDGLIEYAKLKTDDHSPEGLKWAIRSLGTKLGTPPVINFRPYVIIPPNADIRLQGVSDDNAGVSVSGSIQGYLAKIV